MRSPILAVVIGSLGGVALSGGRVQAGQGRQNLQITATCSHSGPVVVEVSGLPEGLLRTLEAPDPEKAMKALLRVYAAPAGGKIGADQPPLAGTYRLEGKVLRFRSRFPGEPGFEYTVRASAGPGNECEAKVSIAKAGPVNATTRVLRVSPSAETVPENLLKFYVEFSAPMSRGKAYEHLSLLDAAGKPLALPFLELGEELWDPDQRRFTALFDPGRIKTGLRPREELGPVLEAGKKYTLVIDPSWPDANGLPLVAGFRKAFTVGPPDLVTPDPSSWIIVSPRAGTRTPLVVRFPEPLDRGMLGRVIGVEDVSGKAIAGLSEVGDGETSWSFTPAHEWISGTYSLVVDSSLEDLAGNAIGRPFEVDRFSKVEVKGPEKVRRRFEIAR